MITRKIRQEHSKTARGVFQSENVDQTDATIRTLAEMTMYVTDHIVDAVGDPSSSLRRATILLDVYAHYGTTQAEILERLDLAKSALNRNIDWLVDHGCILRGYGYDDARQVPLRICDYSRRHLDMAARYFDGDANLLQSFIISFMNSMEGQRPSLRELKILATVQAQGETTRQSVFDLLYNGPPSTDSRTLTHLIETGWINENAE